MVIGGSKQSKHKQGSEFTTGCIIYAEGGYFVLVIYNFPHLK